MQRLIRVSGTVFALATFVATSLAAQRRQGPGQPIGAVDPRNSQTQKPPLHCWKDVNLKFMCRAICSR